MTKAYNKRALLLIFILIIIPMLGLVGCWDPMIVEEVGFILSLGLDIHEDDPNRYIVTQSSPVFVTVAEESVEILSATAKSPMEAIQFFNKVGGRNYVSDQLLAFVISKEVAQKGNLLTLLDFIYRNPRISSLANLIISEEPAQEVINAKLDAKNRIAMYLKSLIDEAAAAGITEAVTLQNFRQLAMDSHIGRDPIVPKIKMLEDSFIISGFALFQGDKMVGELTETESDYYLILSEKGTPVVFMSQGDAVYGFFPFSINTNIKPFIKDDNIVFEIKVKLELMVDQSFCSVSSDLTNPKNKEKLEAQTAEHLKGEFLKLIKKMQEVNSDPLGLGKRFRAKYFNVFKEIDWHEYYPYAEVHVDVFVTISRHGLVK